MKKNPNPRILVIYTIYTNCTINYPKLNGFKQHKFSISVSAGQESGAT